MLPSCATYQTLGANVPRRAESSIFKGALRVSFAQNSVVVLRCSFR